MCGIHASTHGCPKTALNHLEWSYRQLGATMWEAGVELRSSAREVSDLNQHSISIAPEMIIFKYKHNRFLSYNLMEELSNYNN